MIKKKTLRYVVIAACLCFETAAFASCGKKDKINTTDTPTVTVDQNSNTAEAQNASATPTTQVKENSSDASQDTVTTSPSATPIESAEGNEQSGGDAEHPVSEGETAEGKQESSDNVSETPTTTPVAEETADNEKTDESAENREENQGADDEADEDDEEDEEESEEENPEDFIDDDEPEDESDDDEDEEENPVEEALRTDAWTDTFLIWLPEFEGGTFVGTNAADTFDYAEFSDVEIEEAKAYVDILRAEGFISEDESGITDTEITYEGKNSDNWCAEVRFSNGNMIIGSGFYEVTVEDKIADLQLVTILGSLPGITMGVYESHSAESDDSSCAVVISGVTEDEMRTYVKELKTAGFVIDEDEGDLDGFIWYAAENEDGLMCDVIYSDGTAKIGCFK